MKLGCLKRAWQTTFRGVEEVHGIAIGRQGDNPDDFYFREFLVELTGNMDWWIAPLDDGEELEL